MNRIDDRIRNPEYYYDEDAVEGFILFCENELTLTDGSDLHLLDTFKLWAEDIFGWYYFEKRSIFMPGNGQEPGGYEDRWVKKRLINKQFLIVARGAAKSMYGSCIQNYFYKCRYDNYTSGDDRTNNETSGRGNVTNQNSHHKKSRTIV